MIAPSLSFNTGGASAPPVASASPGGILGAIVKVGTGILTGEYGYEKSKEAGISKFKLGDIVYVYDHRTHDVRMYNASDPNIPTDAIDRTADAEKRIYLIGGSIIGIIILLNLVRR